MSRQEIDRFWAQVSDDRDLKAAVPEGAAADVLATFAQERGFDVTTDDVLQHESASEELSEEALDAVAGGGDMPPQDPIDPVEDPIEFPPPEEDPTAPPSGEGAPPPEKPKY